MHTISHLKERARCTALVTLILSMSFVLIPISGHAQAAGAAASAGKGAVEMWILKTMEKWKGVQEKQWYKGITNFMEELSTLEQSLETAKQTAGYVGKAYNTAKAVSTGYESLEGIYYAGRQLYGSSVYAYNYTKDALTSGRIRARDAAQMWKMLDNINREAFSVTKGLTDIFFPEDDDNPITFEMKMEALKRAQGRLSILSHKLKKETQKLEDNMDAEASQEAFEAFIRTAYGPNGKLAQKGNVYAPKMPTLETMGNAIANAAPKNHEEAKNQIKDDASEANHDDKELTELTSTITGWGLPILNIVCMIIGFIGIFLMLPAFMRQGRDQQQAKDSLFKIMESTILIIVIMQIVGRIFLGIIG